MLDPRPAVRLGPSEDQRQHGSTRGAAPVRAGSPHCGVSVVKEAKASFHFLFLPSQRSEREGQRARRDAQTCSASVYLHACANEEEEKVLC